MSEEGPETIEEPKISFVEIFGGGLRMPAIQNILNDLFGKVYDVLVHCHLNSFKGNSLTLDNYAGCSSWR